MKAIDILPDSSQIHTVFNGTDELRILINYNQHIGMNTITAWQDRDSICPDIAGVPAIPGEVVEINGRVKQYIVVLSDKRYVIISANEKIGGDSGVEC